MYDAFHPLSANYTFPVGQTPYLRHHLLPVSKAAPVAFSYLRNKQQPSYCFGEEIVHVLVQVNTPNPWINSKSVLEFGG